MVRRAPRSRSSASDRWPAALLLGVALACTPSPPDLRLGRIVIDTPPQFDADQASREEIRTQIHARLEADDGVDGFVRTPEATHHLHVRVHPVTETGERKVRPIEVGLRSLGPEPTFETVGQGGLGDDLRQAVLQGFDEAWPVLGRMRALAVQKDAAVLEALTDADARIRGFAIDELGRRRSTAAAPALLALLKSEEKEDLVLRAVGALVAIGDQSSVGPLIDLTYQKDPAFVLQIVFAVSAIGGRAAEGFLVTLAGGHPHPAVQQGAKDALDELQKRARPQGG